MLLHLLLHMLLLLRVALLQLLRLLLMLLLDLLFFGFVGALLRHASVIFFLLLLEFCSLFILLVVHFLLLLREFLILLWVARIGSGRLFVRSNFLGVGSRWGPIVIGFRTSGICFRMSGIGGSTAIGWGLVLSTRFFCGNCAAGE